MNKLNKATRKMVSFLLVLTLAMGIPMPSMRTTPVANAAEQTTQTRVDIITGGQGSFQKTLSTGENATVVLDDCRLTVTVGTETYKFNPVPSGTISSEDLHIVGQVALADDDLLHIFALSNKYYSLDLRNGAFTLYEVWRDRSSWKYVRSNASGSDPVYGSSFIDTKYFYQRITVNDKSRERLVTREDLSDLFGSTPSVTPSATPDVPSSTNKPSSTDNPLPTDVPVTSNAPLFTEKPSATNKPSTDDPGSISGTIDINWWYDQYLKGTITWDQLMQILYQYNWNAKKDVTSTSTTYYFYNEKGQLIKQETVTTGSEISNGSGSGSATVKTDGKADVNAQVKGNGQASINVNLVSSKLSSDESSKSTYYHVKRKGNWVKLVRVKNNKVVGVICKVYFNKKKGIAKFDGITYKKIKYVGFTAGSRMIFMLSKSQKASIVPRVKGQIGNVYTKKILKGKWKLPIENHSGLVIRVSNKKSKVMGVKNAKPKKIKKAKK